MRTRSAIALGALVCAAAFTRGPLGFLPPLLLWPLVAAAVLPLAYGPRTLAGREAAATAELPLLVCAFVVFALLKVPGVHASQSDDNVYLYLAARVAAGEVPYRDFFFAHPPLHLAVPAVVFRAARFSVGLGKAIPVAAQALTALLLWRGARVASRPYALAVLLLHLTAYQVLMGASDLNGGNLAAMFLAAGLLAALRGAPLAAGALAGAAIGTVLYAASGLFAVGLAAAARGGRRAAVRYAAGLFAAVAAVHGSALALGGPAYLQGVFGFHLRRPAGAGRVPVLGLDGPTSLEAFVHNLGALSGATWRTLYFHAPLASALAASAILLAAGVARRRSRTGDAPPAVPPVDGRPTVSEVATVTPATLALVGWAGAVLALLQSAALPEVHGFYALPAMPFVALAAAYGPVALAERLAAGGRGARLAAAGLAAVAAHPLVSLAALPRAFPEEARLAGAPVRYAWPDPEVPAALARASRALVWSGARLRGRAEPAWRHAVWSKAAAFGSAREIAAYVRARSAPGETVTGASTLAPLVALLADRRIAGGEADTNAKRFAAGSLAEGPFLARILADRVAFVVASPRSFFTEERLEEDPAWAAAFVRDATFADAGLGRGSPVPVVLYRRR